MALLRSSAVAQRRLRAVVGSMQQLDGRASFVPAARGHQERYDAREDALAISSLLKSLERPRYADVAEEVNPLLVEKIVLVFEDVSKPPVEVTIPPMVIAEPRPIIYAPPQTEEARQMREQRTAAQQREIDRDIKAAARFGMSLAMTDEEIDEPTVDAQGRRVLVDGLEPIISKDEAALAAYRALVAEASQPPAPPHPIAAIGDHDDAASPRATTKSQLHMTDFPAERRRGDHGRVQTWAVVTHEDGQRISRLYVGTEAALRATFPDLDEVERMTAAGVLGAPNFARAIADDARGWPVLVPMGHSLPATPIRIRRVGFAPLG